MTNLTNEQITDIWEAMPSGAQGWLKEFGYIQFARGIEEAVAAKFAPRQQPEPIGVVSPMPGASGFTMACFAAEDAPAGTKLYLAATTQASTAQAEPADLPEATDEAREYLVEWHKANLPHAPYFSNYIRTDLAGDFAFHLARWFARNATPAAQPAATSTPDAQPPRTKAQIIALANAAGIDTDDEGDIFGSTNGAIFAFVEALGVRAAGEVRDAALEEAAKLCEQTPSGDAHADAALELAAERIRALRSAGDTGGAQQPLTRCAASRDGDCSHAQCPQKRDNEPATSARHCPLDNHNEED